MELTELIKKQEKQSKLALSDEERTVVTAFFEARMREQTRLNAVNPEKKTEKESANAENRLRDDAVSTTVSPEDLLSRSPDTVGAFVRVPKSL